MHFDGIWFCRHFRAYSHDSGWPITLQWVHVRDGGKCSCYGKRWGEGTKSHPVGQMPCICVVRILLKRTDWAELSYPQHSLLHPFSVYQIHPKPPKSCDASGRRMWQQTSLASMSCWAWELLGVVANCAWKRCCLGEKGKGWSNWACFLEHDTNMCKHWITLFNLYTRL